MKNFSDEDLKAGMLVELHNGVLGILIPICDELEVFSVVNMEAKANAYLLKKSITDSIDKSYGIVKVYGLANNYNLFDPLTRDLLWEYKEEPKNLTVKQIEKLLGYSINIVGSEE